MSIISTVKAVVPKIGSNVKMIAGKPLSVSSKVLGIGTIASVIYDSHVNGKEKAVVSDEIGTGNRFYNQYKQYMNSDKESATLCRLKKMWFDAQQSYSYFHIGTRIRGYVSAFTDTMLGNLPLVGLSAVAIKFKRIGKVAGILLGLNAAKTVLYDVMGIGAKKS